MQLTCLNELPLIEKAPGEDIFSQGGDCRGLYILETGVVEIFKNDVYLSEISEKGASFGEMAYLLGHANTATVRAKVASTFRFIEDSSVHLETNPELLLYVAKIMAHRLNAVNEYLAEIKSQYGGQNNHFDFMDDILKALLLRHPETAPQREIPDDDDPPIPGSR